MNAVEIGKRIRERRKELDLTLEQLATALGYNKSTLQRYEAGKIDKIKLPTLQTIAQVLRVDPNWLALKTDEKSENYYIGSRFPSPSTTDDFVTFPVIGEIAAGYDSIVMEEWTGEKIDIPTSYLKGREISEYFVLGVKGDSMYPEYHNGDKVLILKQTTLDYSGQVGAVLYNGENATLKKVEYKEGENWMRLVPINPSVAPQLIEGTDLENCKILGIPRLLVRDIKN